MDCFIFEEKKQENAFEVLQPFFLTGGQGSYTINYVQVLLYAGLMHFDAIVNKINEKNKEENRIIHSIWLYFRAAVAAALLRRAGILQG